MQSVSFLSRVSLLKVPWGDISAGFYRSFHFAEDPVVMAFLSDDLTRAWVLWRPSGDEWRVEFDQVMAALNAAGFDTAQLREMDTGFPELEAYR